MTLPVLQTGGRQVGGILPTTSAECLQMAEMIKESGMCPKEYATERPAKIAVAILQGLEVGLAPLAALNSIAVINGRPTIWGDGALALVRASGQLEDIEETLEGSGEGMVATCRIKRKGQATEIIRQFGVFEAKEAGLWQRKGKNGSPTPWTTYPGRMLAMRARSWALRDGFADVLKGMGISEEVQDQTGNYARDVTPAPAETAPEKPKEEDYQEPAKADNVIDVEPGEAEAAEFTLLDITGEVVRQYPKSQAEAFIDDVLEAGNKIKDARLMISWYEHNQADFDVAFIEVNSEATDEIHDTLESRYEAAVIALEQRKENPR